MIRLAGGGGGRRALPAVLAACALSLSAPGVAADRLRPDPQFGNPAGLIVLMRHAEAPGVGDPPGFRLDDCATQRNLDEAGRAQARRIGDRLRAAGIREAHVLSSQWCRCLETARLLDLGPVEPLATLNSFINSPDEEPRRVAELRRFLAGLPRDGKPVVLVTHQVTVTALTAIFPASGEAVLMRADGDGEPPLLGRLKDGGVRP